MTRVSRFGLAAFGGAELAPPAAGGVAMFGSESSGALQPARARAASTAARMKRMEVLSSDARVGRGPCRRGGHGLAECVNPATEAKNPIHRSAAPTYGTSQPATIARRIVPPDQAHVRASLGWRRSRPSG